MTSNHHAPCFRLYLGKGNWMNLGSKITADLKAIYEQGVPTRYNLAPGLAIDILPNDVDCNSKTTELPNLMRADLCYDQGDDSTSNDAGRQEATLQNLSRFVKSALENQGIVDAFPHTDAGQPLPHVYDLAPHRHLNLVPTQPKTSKRINHSDVLNHPSPDHTRRKPKKGTRRNRRPTKEHGTPPSDTTPPSVDTSPKKATTLGKRTRHPSAYHLRSNPATELTLDHSPSPSMMSHYQPKTGPDTLHSFDGDEDDEERTDFFPVADFMNNNRQQLWNRDTGPPALFRQQLKQHDSKSESTPTGWELYGFNHQHQPQQHHQQDFDIYSSSTYSSSSHFQPPSMVMSHLYVPNSRPSSIHYPDYPYSFFMPPESAPRTILPSSPSPPSPFSTNEQET
ncbi:hypothetical protein BC941DRAFT_508098 [Chlamydoabsidia padenii]|nr:hypothetical protein BC941DRAFT_508098 [Chlamydoabsidia padenii]